jgi:SAM-dependent methyltransferase
MDYQPRTFGERFAATYDSHPERADTSASVDLLEEFARGGPVLELAIGTGRVALPLAWRGLRVDGVEVSPDIVAKLRAKPGGDQVQLAIRDMKDVPVSGQYPLIYLVFNTLFNLITQDDQVGCFENVAAHLVADGVFLIEAVVPDLRQFRNDQYVQAEAVELDEVRLDVCRLDSLAQRLDKSHLVISNGGVHAYPVVLRYVWPSEMDLMARIAGLRLQHRWASWTREPLTSTSTSHISVYGRYRASAMVRPALQSVTGPDRRCERRSRRMVRPPAGFQRRSSIASRPSRFVHGAAGCLGEPRVVAEGRTCRRRIR